MRNLKKILALVLALVMSLSLMATAGAADTGSGESVNDNYKTATDVLQALRVFRGYEDGTFKPQSNITRAEVAAILYRIVTGDVEDTQQSIYTDMANTKFSDLANANWARGYINYCANAQLIVGMGDNTFKPQQNITGYATLAMILRALGYDKNGEFKGSGWEIRTASTARELGILKNVSESLLGSPATRELVSELLFRAMLCDTVRYDANSLRYVSDGKGSLGFQVFTLEEVQGVVMANEYGDIRRDENGKGNSSVIAADTTVLRDAEGNDRTVNYGSGLDDLGLTRVAYTVKDGNKYQSYLLKNLQLDDPDVDEVTWDDGEYVEKVSSKISGTKAQHFVNYGEDSGETRTTIKITYQAKKIADTIIARTEALAIQQFCEKYHLKSSTIDASQLWVRANYTGSGSWRIIYTPDANDETINETDYRVGKDHIYSIVEVDGVYYYRVEIAPDVALNSTDEYMIDAIFTTANRNPENSQELVVDGEVFKGTQTRFDYSDWQSYEAFEADCLKVIGDADNTIVKTNPLGYRLRIIDNNRDGITDWVFQTKYTVATIKSEKDGEITLENESPWTDCLASDSVNSLSKASATANEGDAVTTGDVVLYAVIDGVARVWKAETLEGRVESINRTKSTITLADGTTKTESAVHEHSGVDDNTVLDSGVVNMAGKTAYTMYLDMYGNLAAFEQNLVGKLTLLTDGWARTAKNGVEYAVKAWDKDSKSFGQYDITSGGNWFINDWSNTEIWESANTWNRIARFVPLNCDGKDDFTAGPAAADIHTTMAYMETDGENATLVPVDMIYDTQRIEGKRPVKMIDMGTFIPDENITREGNIYATTIGGGFLNNRPVYDNGVYSLLVDENGIKVDPTNAAAVEAAKVEVRALSNTVYYYVYRTWYGSTPTMVVQQLEGYSNDNWMNLKTDNNKFVEDVYVVGTEATRVDAFGATGYKYYTADAVVIELNDDFYKELNLDHEQVFVYDFENVVNSINLEKVRAIRADGTDTELTIDLTRSDRVYVEGSNKYSEPAPGLFYLWRTNATTSDGETVWAIKRMAHEDITDNSALYNVGTVRNSRFTVPANYVNVFNWFNTNAGYDWLSANTWTDSSVADEGVTTENTKYYTLSYSEGRYGYVSTLTPTDAKTALSESASDLVNGNTNEVLVRYNAGSNKIAYVISFLHGTHDIGGENYAQQVYRGVTKYQAKGTTPPTDPTAVTLTIAPAAATIKVGDALPTFTPAAVPADGATFGEGKWTDKDGNAVTDPTAAAGEYTVTYTATLAEGNFVWADGEDGTVSAKLTVTEDETPAPGNETTANVTWYDTGIKCLNQETILTESERVFPLGVVAKGEDGKYTVDLEITIPAKLNVGMEGSTLQPEITKIEGTGITATKKDGVANTWTLTSDNAFPETLALDVHFTLDLTGGNGGGQGTGGSTWEESRMAIQTLSTTTLINVTGTIDTGVGYEPVAIPDVANGVYQFTPKSLSIDWTTMEPKANQPGKWTVKGTVEASQIMNDNGEKDFSKIYARFALKVSEDLGAAKKLAQQAVIDAATAKVNAGGLEGPQIQEVINIRNQGIVAIENAGTIDAVNSEKESFIKAINAVKNPTTLDTDIDLVPVIFTGAGQITLNYYLGGTSDDTFLTKDALIERLNKNEKNIKFTLMKDQAGQEMFYPNYTANGEIGATANVTGSDGASYAVTATRVFKVTLNDNVDYAQSYYVSAANTRIMLAPTSATVDTDVPQGVYLEADTAADTTVAATGSNTANGFFLGAAPFVAVGATPIAQTTDPVDASVYFEDKDFVLAQEVTKDVSSTEAAADGVSDIELLVAAPNGVNPVTIDLNDGAPVYVQNTSNVTATVSVKTFTDQWNVVIVDEEKQVATEKQIPTTATAPVALNNVTKNGVTDDLTIGLVQGVKVVVDGQNCGVYKKAAASVVETTKTGLFVPYFKTAGVATFTSDTKYEVVSGEITMDTQDSASINDANDIINLVPAIAITVPCLDGFMYASDKDDFGGMTFDISYAGNTKQNYDWEETTAGDHYNQDVYMAKGTTMLIKNVTTGKVRVDFTADGALTPETVATYTPNGDKECGVITLDKTGGTYKLVHMLPVDSIELANNSAATDLSVWKDLATAVSDVTVNGIAYAANMMDLTTVLDKVTAGKIIVATSTAAPSEATVAASGNEVTVTLTVDAVDGYYFTTATSFTPATGFTVGFANSDATPATEDCESITITFTYTVA